MASTLANKYTLYKPKQQVIFALRYAAGFKVDQIAKILLSQPETITKTLQRIKGLIKSEKLELFAAHPIVTTETKTSYSIFYTWCLVKVIKLQVANPY